MAPLRFDVPKNHGFRSNLYTIPFDFDSNGPVFERKNMPSPLKLEISCSKTFILVKFEDFQTFELNEHRTEKTYFFLGFL